MAQIKKLADSKYLIRVSKGTGSGRTYINKTFRGTKAKAKEYARDQETLLDSGHAPESAFTFEQYFDQWLKAIGPKLSPRTLDGYEGYIRRYAFDSIKGMKLADIRLFHLQTVYIDIRKSPTTVRNLHAALRTCFAYAVKRGYLRANPCTNADLPAKVRNEIVVMTNEEAARFAEVCREMQNGVIFGFALETGMRPEEYLALRWRDIAGREVSVAQAVQFNRKGGGYYFKDVKTARGRRRIPISETMRLRLVTHRREQNEHRLAMKSTWFNYDLVFPNEVGRPFAINNITRRYLQPILDKCEFGKHITLYALRHSCATLLLMQGANPKTVADRLGHSSVVITLDTYSHVLPHIQDAATDMMESIMRGVK